MFGETLFLLNRGFLGAHGSGPAKTCEVYSQQNSLSELVNLPTWLISLLSLRDSQELIESDTRLEPPLTTQ